MCDVNFNSIRELMGHADMKTTMRYAHLSQNHKRQAVNLLCQRSPVALVPSPELPATLPELELATV